MNNKLATTFISLALVALAGCPSGSNEDDGSSVGVDQGSVTQSDSAIDAGDGNVNTTGGSVDSLVLEERFVELVNEARGAGHRCGDADYPAVGPVVWSERIEAAALKHSIDMSSRDTLSHTGVTGSNVGERLSAEGYRWRMVSENIAAGFVTPEVAVQGWLDSEGHCINIMNGDFTQMGVSSADSLGENSVRYWTQVFALPNS